MKKEYNAPEIEIVTFSAPDVITSSGAAAQQSRMSSKNVPQIVGSSSSNLFQ